MTSEIPEVLNKLTTAIEAANEELGFERVKAYLKGVIDGMEGKE